MAFLDARLKHTVTLGDFEQAIERPLQKIIGLLTETIAQGQTRPDVVYVTGGTGQSPSVRRAVRAALGDIPIAQGDAFGSVVSGLAYWAEKIYR